MDNFEIQLNLVGNLQKQADQCAKAVRGIEAASNKAQAMLDKLGSSSVGAQFAKHAAAMKKAQQGLSFGDAIEKQMQKTAKLSSDPKGFVMLRKAQEDFKKHQNRLLESAGLKKGGESSFGKELGKELGFSTITAASLAAGALEKGAEFMIEAAHKVAEIVIDGFKSAVEASAKEEKLRLAFKLSLGGKAGEFALEDAARFSKLTQFTGTQTAGMLLPLRRAGFNEKAARQTIATAGDVQAGGGMNAQDFIELATHIKLKGGVNEKQLMRAGFNTEQIFKTIAKAKGIGVESAKKLATEGGGKIDPQLILNALTQAQNTKQGGGAGTGALAASNTLDARLEKLKALPEEYLRKLSQSPSFNTLSDRVGDILKRLDPESEEGQRIMSSLNNAFKQVVDWVDKITSKDGIAKIASGLQTAVDLAGSFLLDIQQSVNAVMQLVDGIKTMANVMASAGLGASGNAWAAKALGTDENTSKGFTGLMNRQVDEVNRINKTYEDDPASATNDPAPAKRASGTGGKVINFQPKIDIHITAEQGDPSHTGQKAASEITRHVVNGLGRAVNEGGG